MKSVITCYYIPWNNLLFTCLNRLALFTLTEMASNPGPHV
jgi:hypothetical protein